MISPKLLLAALQKRVLLLEDDLRARCNAQPEVDAPLRKDYEAAREKGRTGLTYNAWRDEELTQIAVAWILAGVFVRFLEDNELIDVPFLAGGNAARHQRAQDEHSLFFRQHPTASERDYFEHVFNTVGKLPGMKDFFDRRHNPLWRVGPTADAAKALLEFWRKTDPDTGRIVHDFTDAEWNTRFLGDLYQDLSEAARKKYALLQTPDFIEEFILDRTLTPAINAFGYQAVRLIDPTCGSGHFCLGAFDRLFRLWQAENPGENPRALAQRALDGIYGVDLNPYAVAIAGFRLLLAALRVSGIHQLKDAPDFKIHVAAGDSLLHGRRFRHHEVDTGPQRTFDTGDEVFRDELKHHYEVEDVEALHRILGQQYHAVVGNPPYITVKDRAVSELYRARFPSCRGKYSLSVPFMERFFDLAVKGDGTPQQPAGFVGQITANSFMKREFGKKLIEEYLPRWDLTHVLDTSWAYIPGHGTPTVILFGKNQPPVSGTIRTVLGIAGEPATPEDPTQGFVWQAILQQIDHPGSNSEWVSAADSPRASFHKHPWSIGGGGLAELKEVFDEAGEKVLSSLIVSSGFGSIVGEDEAFTFPPNSLPAHGLPSFARRPFVEGDTIRDWAINPDLECLFPYDADVNLLNDSRVLRALWPLRAALESRRDFSKRTYKECGRPHWEYHQIPIERNRAKTRIAFAFVATHNQFVFDSGNKVFKQSAPIINLPSDASEDTLTRLVGLLNSSGACFWMKQVFFPKGGDHVGKEGARVRKTLWDERYEFDSTKLASFPIPARQPSQLPTALVKTSTALQGQSPAATLASWGGPESGDLRPWLASARDLATRQRRQLIAWQEELDWQIYEAFGLVPGAAESGPAAVSLPEGAAVDAIPPEGIELGQRAFEIVLARRMAAGEAQSTWFERHGSTPITEVPRHWPAPYRELVERRLRRIADDPNIRLIEQPEYKRRWNTEPWDEQLQRALREWLLKRLEGYFHEGHRVCELKDGFSSAAHGFPAASQPVLVSTNQLATVVEADTTFLCVAEVYSGGPGFSVSKLVRELVEAESVPFLPFQRYKDAGLRKRQDWEHVWDLQREEDEVNSRSVISNQSGKTAGAVPATGSLNTDSPITSPIPVPPKYASGDFKKSHWWKLRGKLDVPKERWIIYPGAEREGDASPVIAWAGWDHAQQAQALAAYYIDASQNQGWSPEKLRPLLAGLADLLPWLKQWHNAFNPDFSSGLGDYFAGFLDEEARKQGTTVDALSRFRLGLASPTN